MYPITEERVKSESGMKARVEVVMGDEEKERQQLWFLVGLPDHRKIYRLN